MMKDLLDMAEAVRSSVAAIPVSERSTPAGTGALGNHTSHIDRVAEDCVIGFMDARGLELNLLSEEAGFVDRGFDDVLVLDPVDGSFNCYSGIPFYSVSMAVGRDSLAGMRDGLVMNLVTGDVYSAASGQGSFLNGKPIHVRDSSTDNVLISYLAASAAPRSYEVASRFRRVRCLGSVALELCLIASGGADALHIEHTDERKSPRVVDIAAGLLILREAGGEAWDANKQILDMPLSLEARKNMMAASHASLLELMQ